jgi:shikimate 5-dehydrogenase
MIEKKAKLSRRNFLLTLGAGGAATAAAIVATKNAGTSPTGTSKDKRATRGYQASEHVNNYYRTTKV